MSSTPRFWLQIDIAREGEVLRARCLGSRGENPPSQPLPGVSVADLVAFRDQVRQAGVRGVQLWEELPLARRIHQALFQGALRDVLQRLHERAGTAPVLLRLMFEQDTLLQSIPWEALCEPDATQGFLGNSPDVLLARGITLGEACPGREVPGAVRLLAVALPGGGAVTRLRAALDARIRLGEVQFEALVGNQARRSVLTARLARSPTPHIIHFVGHGQVDARGQPQLQFLDELGNEMWLDVELLANDLRRHCIKTLRLIVLDACEGARPAALASAAERLVRTAADAVVAHLWPVRADITQACSEAFYRTLTRAAERQGDVALSLSEARNELLSRFHSSAEAFSPVLYLRHPDAVLFNFRDRVVAPPRSSPEPEALDTSFADFQELLSAPFTLVLGDRWSCEQDVREAFRKRLRQALARQVGPLPEGISLSALTEHYVLRFEEQDLDAEFQQVFGKAAASLPLIARPLQALKPGVHVTLLRQPLMELALAELRPDATLHVIHPPGREGGRALLLRREGGTQEWTKDIEPPESLYPERDYIVLRLYRGFLPKPFYVRPMLTEDDYLLGVGELGSMLTGELFSEDLIDELVAGLRRQPAFLMGISLLTWHHRMLLHRLFKQGVPGGSMVLLEHGEQEREMWEQGRGLPARVGVKVVVLPPPRPPHPPGPEPLGAP